MCVVCLFLSVKNVLSIVFNFYRIVKKGRKINGNFTSKTLMLLVYGIFTVSNVVGIVWPAQRELYTEYIHIERKIQRALEPLWYSRKPHSENVFVN